MPGMDMLIRNIGTMRKEHGDKVRQLQNDHDILMRVREQDLLDMATKNQKLTEENQKLIIENRELHSRIADMEVIYSTFPQAQIRIK